MKLIQAAVQGDEFASVDEKITNEDVKNALNQKAVRDKADLQNEIIETLQCADLVIKQHVDEIRAIRRREAKQKKILEKINKAREIATTTGNFLPLLTVLGRVSPGIDGLSRQDFEQLVPEEFRQ